MEHVNYITGKQYTCGNAQQLDSTFSEKGYSEAIWGTYNQFKKIGGQVKKGEKGTLLRHPAVIPNGFDSEGNQKFKSGMKHFNVFNVEQVHFNSDSDFNQN